MLSLDVGCGRNKRGDVGIDYDPKSKADIICDIHNIPFRDNIFYRVKSYCVLEHSYNPSNFFKEQYRVLRDGGVIICLTDNAQYFRWTVMKFRGIKHEDMWKDHYMIFFPENVVRLLSRNGFIKIKWMYVPFEGKMSKQEKIINILIKIGIFRFDCLYPRIFFYAKKPSKT
jgi:ubiquinone/menaquinone biosynthesis C-methylase UbiE